MEGRELQMNDLQVALIDDMPLIGDTVEQWLASGLDELGPDPVGGTLDAACVTPYDTVEGFLADVDDREFHLDLVIVDLVILGSSHGGLTALSAMSKHRPDTPVLVFSQLENNGDRFLYALAAANWFDSQLRALVPKVLGSSRRRSAGPEFRRIAAEVLAGTHVDPALDFLRSDGIAAAFTTLLGKKSDLERWRAIHRYPKQGPASRMLGISEQSLRDWEAQKLAALDLLWDAVVEQTPINGSIGRFRPATGKTHEQLKDFTGQQLAFFSDAYLDERFAD